MTKCSVIRCIAITKFTSSGDCKLVNVYLATLIHHAIALTYEVYLERADSIVRIGEAFEYEIISPAFLIRIAFHFLSKYKTRTALSAHFLRLATKQHTAA